MDPQAEVTNQNHSRSAFDSIEQANEARFAELIALQRIGRELNSTFDMDQILNLLIHDVVSVTPATHGSVLLFDQEARRLLPRSWYGFEAQQFETFKMLSGQSDSGIVYRVFKTGRTAITDDVRLAPDYLEVVPTTRSELTVPIRYGQEIVGVIDLESPELSAFGFDNQRFVEAIAEQAAIAIGNAQRYAEQVAREDTMRLRNEQLRNLIAISHELHTEYALGDILDQIVQAIPATGGFRVAMLSLVEDDPPTVRRVAAAGITLDEFEALQQVRRPLSAFDRVWQEQYRISRSYFLPHEHQEDWEPGLHIYTVLKDNGSWQEGNWHPNDVLVTPLRDSKGQLLGWLSVDDPFDGRVPSRETIEILELFANEAASAIENARLYDELELRVRKRTEELAQALRRQAVEVEQTRAIVESISDAVLVFDAKGKIILVNSATARVLGLTASSLLQHGLEETDFRDLHPKDQEMTAALFRTARAAKESLAHGQDLVSSVFRAARRVIQVSYSPVALREGEPLTMVAVFRDITAEAELDRMKSEFISMVAHELRTPMTSITGYVDLLMLGMLGPVTDKQSEFLQVVKHNAQRLLTLASDLLDVSRMESQGLKLHLQATSAADVVAEAVIAMEKQIEAKEQSLVVDVPRDLPEVTADRDRIIQVVTNLLSNAHKYSPRDSRIEIHGQRTDGHLELTVKDAGIGISSEDRKRLFTRFFRADNAILTEEDGTGLGLAICLEIVERHGGEIQVDSELGKGSTFRILLPLEESPARGDAYTEDVR
jgi:PAS domain S-box-containing protein